MSENFRGVTFAEQSVTPADDAIVRRAILPDGTLTGCEISYSGSTLTMAAGYIIACGRTFQHIAAQNWAVVDATSGFARLVLTIDLTKTATEATFNQIESNIEYAAAEDGFVDLEQSDINLSGTRYQIAAAVVSLGTGGITGIVSQLALSRVEGGGGLNFSVVDGLTQPSDPKDNMIWVYTEGMTGWHFAAEQPENMQPGEVWFSTGISSAVAFNAAKKNAVMVYPLAAKQMLEDSTLADVTAKSWQNGDWVEWITLLDLTSGWIQAASGYGWSGGSVVCGERLTLTNKSYAHMVAAVKETVIDFTEIETITAVIDSDSSGLTNGKNWLVIVDSTSISWNPGTGGLALPQKGYVAGIEFNTPGEITLDTSEIQGQYYVAILATAEKTVYCSRISY